METKALKNYVNFWLDYKLETGKNCNYDYSENHFCKITFIYLIICVKLSILLIIKNKNYIENLVWWN